MSNSRSNKGRQMATRTERRRAAVDRRREFTRRSVTAQVAARRRRSRIRWSVGAVAVAVLGIGAIVLIANRDGGGGIPNVTLTGKKVDADGALGITAPLSAYTVDYEVTTYSSDPQNPTKGTQKLRVSRPFSSEITITDAEGVASTYTKVLGKFESLADGTTTVSAEAAGAGLYDWRLDASLDDLVASGKVTMKERREVAGRECQVYRTGSPLEGGTVVAATETDYAEMCIDASGLLLEEVFYINGLPAQHVKAETVNEDPVDDLAIDGEPADTSTSFTEIDAATAPADGFWSLSTVPEGYELVGRYAFTKPGQAPDESTTETTVPVDTTLPIDTTLPVQTTTPAETTAAPTDSTATDSTSGAQGFVGSNVIAAATSTTAAPATTGAAATTDAPTTTAAPTATTVPAGDSTTLPADTTPPTTAAPEVPPVTSWFDVYRNGADYLIVQQGPTAGQPSTNGTTSDATIDGLGAVTTSSAYDGTLILAHPSTPADWFVAISGSVNLETLTSIAGTLAS